MQQCSCESVKTLAHWRVRHGDGKHEGTDSRERRFGVRTRIMRGVDRGVSDEGEDGEKRGRCPPVGEMLRMSRQGDAEQRDDREQTSLARDTEMTNRESGDSPFRFEPAISRPSELNVQLEETSDRPDEVRCWMRVEPARKLANFENIRVLAISLSGGAYVAHRPHPASTTDSRPATRI